MRQKYVETQALPCPLTEPGKSGIDHKPGGDLVGLGLTKDEIVVDGRDVKTRGRKLYVDAAVQRLIGEVAGIGNRKAPGVQNHRQGLQAVIDVLNPAAGFLTRPLHYVLVNDRPDGLGRHLPSGETQRTKAYGPERDSPGPLSKS